MGLGAVIVTVTLLSLAISAESSQLRNYTITPVSNEQTLYRQVAAASSITEFPKDLQPVPVRTSRDDVIKRLPCQASTSQSRESICILGDTTAKRLMVVYGDSYALMWLPAFDNIARTAHLRLVILAKPACPAELVAGPRISQPIAQRTGPILSVINGTTGLSIGSTNIIPSCW